MFYPEIFKLAVETAKRAPINEVPVSAIVAVESEIISVATNATFASGKDWHHAEYVAVCDAINKLRVRYLDNASVYVTLEPCIFCSALLEKVRVGHIYFGAYNTDKPAITECLSKFGYLKNNIEIIGGIYEQACNNILVNFFNKMRNNERSPT